MTGMSRLDWSKSLIGKNGPIQICILVHQQLGLGKSEVGQEKKRVKAERAFFEALDSVGYMSSRKRWEKMA